ncbi:MAG: ABC transporter permease [Pseudomonadota bacterium]|nr:ABC transporter permease [Pseudomonadota bacterium]
MDTAGALLLRRLVHRLEAGGATVTTQGLESRFKTLFDAVSEEALADPAPQKKPSDPLAPVVALGKKTTEILSNAAELVAFLGVVTETLGRLVVNPRRLRLTSLVWHIVDTGWKALPILGLLSFLIGVVLAWQAADQLRPFGADRYVVNLLGISILREIGVLLTAIIVAGRSGSAFTAQIGTMKVNQEVDALQTMGLDPVETLVAPRILALVLVLPLLTFYGDLAGLAGGALMSWAALGINFSAFLAQLKSAVTTTTLWVGLVKAPMFAFVIALVGCHQGLQVSGSAESVGQRTTLSVVQAIFLVIILDAVFSIAFSIMKI